MKLKHIFENTPRQPKMTVQQVEAALEDFNFWPDNFPKEKLIRIDDRGLIHIDGDLGCKKKMSRMPLQLESVSGLNISGLKTLEGLPRQILNYLDLHKFMGSDLAMPAGNHVIMGPWQTELYLFSCPNLTTLKGIENFISDNGEKIKIIIKGCDNLAFDPYTYRTNYKFEFRETIPPQTSLVEAVALIEVNQISFNFLKDRKLAAIIEKYRGEEASMPSLALELASAGYRGHAGLT